MKRRSIIAALVAIMVVMSTAFVFADDDAFKLESSYPTNGQKNTSIENVGVKIHFNHSLSSKEAQANNDKCVEIVGPKGESIPIKVLTSKKDPGLLLVLADNTEGKYTFEGNSDYTLKISPDLMDDEGNRLGKEETITFRTFNQKANNIINTIMMVVMFGGITVVMVKQTKDQQKEKEELKKDPKELKKDAAFNPYREAKKTGKSVEQVMAEEKKRQAKAAKKEAKKNKDKPAEPPRKLGDLSEILPYVHHVSRPRPISEVGGKTISGKGPKPEPAKKKRTSNVKRGTGKVAN